MVFGIPAVSLVMSYMFYDDFVASTGDGQVSYGHCFVVGMVYTSIYWFTFKELLLLLRKQFPALEQNAMRVALSVVIIIGAFFILDFIVLKWAMERLLHFLGGATHTKNLTSGLGALLVSFLIISIYEGHYYLAQLQKVVLEKEQMARAHLKSELQGLRNQVNPHFLFNSLNTLMGIVAEDKDLAIDYLQKLSKVFRYVLESREQQLVSLETELEFIKAYSFLQEERFKGNLNIVVEIPDKYLNRQVLPLSLQMLFENAIKHNVISKKRPLTVRVFIDQDRFITVQNNLQRKEQVMHSTKVGLENVRMRYGFFTQYPILVEENEYFFSVSLPLLQLEHNKIDQHESAYR